MKNILLGLVLTTGLFADLIPADVTTPSGSYSVYVDVSGNTVNCVQWDNGGCMTVFGAAFDKNGFANGENRRGQSMEIQVDVEELK